MTADVAVYGDWDGLVRPIRLGWLHARAAAGREIFSFEFETAVLAEPVVTAVQLDPRIGFFSGEQYPPADRETFGIFADASPDRWGRLLMERRLERDKRAGRFPETARLRTSDYLLGVHDAFRVGALRFKLDDAGQFLDHRDGVAAPPWAELRALEAASLALERDEDNTASAGDDWLRMLIAPGGSLGGARPKASVSDAQRQLWIAKFPSARDEHDVGAWELLAQTLARGCGLRVPETIAKRFSGTYHTLLVRRFDRTASGRRLHFASAMTLADRQDGDDASTGASYLDLARVLITQGAFPDVDLRELWSRIVFNMLISNSDDHLRNHGFILRPGRGWQLSELYDVNPVPRSPGLKLNVSEVDNSLDLELARSVARFFRVSAEDASAIIERSRAIVRQWPRVAAAQGLPAREQDRMADAFRLAR